MNLVLSVVVAYLFGTFAASVNAIPVSPSSSLVARAYFGPMPSTGTSSSSPGSHGERCNSRTFVTYHPGHYYGEYRAAHPSHVSIHPWEKFGYDKREIWYAIWKESVQTRDEYKGKVEQMITMEQAHLAAGNQGARRATWGLEKLLNCFSLEDTSNADTIQWRSWQNLDTELFIQWANAEISRVGKIILSAPEYHFLSPAIAVYKSLKTDREAASRKHSGPVSPDDMTVEREADIHISRWEATPGWH